MDIFKLIFMIFWCLFWSFLAWIKWYSDNMTVNYSIAQRRVRIILNIVPTLNILFLFTIISKYSALEVRVNDVFIDLYALAGNLWLAIFNLFIPAFNLSIRDDMLERKNYAASYGIIGALIGITFAFAGANIGENRDFIAVFFCASFATAGLFLSWFLLETMHNISDYITIDRDSATSIRLGGFLVAAGLIFGYAVAGNWVSEGVTIIKFLLLTWPVSILTIIAALINFYLRPTPKRPTLPPLIYGVIPAGGYLAFAMIYLLIKGYR